MPDIEARLAELPDQNRKLAEALQRAANAAELQQNGTECGLTIWRSGLIDDTWS